MSIPIGSHLWVKRTLYTHHGIYIGNNKVIHYSGLANGLQSGPVSEVSLLSFSSDSDINVRKYKVLKYKPDEIVERVKSRIGENLYSVHANNCEHFCCWAITGEHRSEQVDMVEDIIGAFSPMGELLSSARTFVRGVRTGDKEIITSTAKSTAKTTGKSLAIATVGTVLAVNPITGPIMGAGYLATKLYRKYRSKD